MVNGDRERSQNGHYEPNESRMKEEDRRKEIGGRGEGGGEREGSKSSN